jgi:hypothetical protein
VNPVTPSDRRLRRGYHSGDFQPFRCGWVLHGVYLGEAPKCEVEN